MYSPAYLFLPLLHQSPKHSTYRYIPKVYCLWMVCVYIYILLVYIIYWYILVYVYVCLPFKKILRYVPSILIEKEGAPQGRSSFINPSNWGFIHLNLSYIHSYYSKPTYPFVGWSKQNPSFWSVKQGNQLTRRPCKGDKFKYRFLRLREKQLVFVGLVQKCLQHGHPFRLAGVWLKINNLCFAWAVSQFWSSSAEKNRH